VQCNALVGGQQHQRLAYALAVSPASVARFSGVNPTRYCFSRSAGPTGARRAHTFSATTINVARY